MYYDKRILDAPVGGVGNMRDARQAVKLDVVFSRHLRQALVHFLAQLPGFGEFVFKGIDCQMRFFQQQRHFLRAR